jgi:hypothetical protein
MGRLSLLVILLFGLSATLSSRHLAFDDDEFQHAHMAWLLARGEVPHRDFFEHHLPLYHFVLAPFTLGSPGPERILALRLLSVCLAMGCLTALAKAIRIWTGADSPGILALTAFSPVFFIKMIEVRPEGFCLLLACVAIALLKNPKLLFLSGLLTGAMVMGSQKFVFLAAGLFFVAWREHGFRPLLRFCGGGLVSPVLFLLYYLVTGAAGAAFQDLVIMNLHWQESFSPAMYGGLLWSGSALLTVSGLLGFARKPAGILLTAGFCAVMVVPIPFRQTFLMLYPGLALGAAFTWQRFGETLANAKSQIAAGLCLSLLGLLPALLILKSDLQSTLSDDLTLMRQMDARGSDPVFDGRCLLFYREHLGHYPWMHQGLMMMLDPDDHAQQSITALTNAGYPDVLWDYRVDMMSPVLHRFIRENYLPMTPAPLWVPGQQIDRSRLRDATEILLPAPGRYQVTWQGGTVQIDGQNMLSGQTIEVTGAPLRIQGNGFIRDFKIYRAEPRP